MHTFLKSPLSGEFSFSEHAPHLPGIGDAYTHLRHDSAAATIKLYFFENAHIKSELFFIRCQKEEFLLFDTGSQSPKIIGCLKDSFYLYANDKYRLLFHDRSLNVTTENSFKIKCKKDAQYLILLVHYLHEQMLYTYKKNILVTKNMMDLIAQVIFPGADEFLTEEAAYQLFALMQSGKVFFQSVVSIEEAEWFHLQKNKLLQIKNERISFSDMMKKAAIKDTRRFRRRMNQLYGVSILQFITEARLAESALLLQNPDLTIKQIAFDTGFKTVNYFSKVFHHYFHEAPGSYRDKLLR